MCIFLPGRVFSLENCLSIFYYCEVDLSDCSGDFSVLKRSVLLFNYYPGGRYRKLAVTTTLAYRIVINCTTAESVLELVSTFCQKTCLFSLNFLHNQGELAA